MTEAEWLTCDDPDRLLNAPDRRDLEWARKRYLFGLACVRRVVHLFPEAFFSDALDVLDRGVEEELTADEVVALCPAINTHPVTWAEAWGQADAGYPDRALAVAQESAAFAVASFFRDLDRSVFVTPLRRVDAVTEATKRAAVALAAEAIERAGPEAAALRAAANAAIAHDRLGPTAFEDFFRVWRGGEGGQLIDEGPDPDVVPANGYEVLVAYAAARRKQADLFRDVFGTPYRPITFSPGWRTSTSVALAVQMYESREFGAMPILADALQDTGCGNDDILNHCRSPGPHVRGCWVVDLVLGKGRSPSSTR